MTNNIKPFITRAALTLALAMPNGAGSRKEDFYKPNKQ